MAVDSLRSFSMLPLFTELVNSIVYNGLNMPKINKDKSSATWPRSNQYIKGTAKKKKADKVISLRLDMDLDEKIRQIPEYSKTIEQWIRERYESEYGSE